MPLYEIEEGTSRKFYRIEREGTRVHLHWGRIDTAGEKQTLELASETEASAEYDRQIWKRRERGYRLVLDENIPHDAEAKKKERLARTAPLTKSPRFYFVNKKAKSFVWVEARESDLCIAEGALGKEATAPVKTETCASPAAAVRKRDAEVAKLLGKGFALADFGAAEAKPKKAKKKALLHNEELEALVREADEGDDAPWTVLEDWLLEHEDPRAEILQLEKSANQRGDAAQARGRLLPLLLGSTALERQRCEWRAGFALDCDLVMPARGADALLEAFAKAPAMRLLRTLTVRGDVVDVPAVLAAIAGAPFARGLRTLSITAVHDAATYAKLFTREVAPNLTSLSLPALPTSEVELVLDALAKSPLLPQLRELAFGWTKAPPPHAAFAHLTKFAR